MVKHTNLKDLFTAIANAIRAKTGSNDMIVADNFPTAIEALDAGNNGQYNIASIQNDDGTQMIAITDADGYSEEDYNRGYDSGKQAEYDRFWDAYQDNGKRTSYAHAFAGRCWTDETFKPKYPIKPDRYGGFRMFESTGITDFTRDGIVLDFSGVQDMRWAFALSENTEIKLPTIDLSNAINTNEIFTKYFGKSLSLIVSEKTVLSYIITQANYLTDLTISGVIATAINLDGCPVLSTESIQSVINALKDLTGQTSQKVQFHTDVLLKITDEQFAQISAKNWTA